MMISSREGGGGTPLYKLYRYVPPHRISSLRSRHLEIVPTRKNARERRRHACLPRARPFFLPPTTSKPLLRRLRLSGRVFAPFWSENGWFLGVADTNDVIQKIEKTLNNTHTTTQKRTNNSFRNTKKHPENGYTLCPFWSGIGYGFRGTTGAHESIYRFTPNEY